VLIRPATVADIRSMIRLERNAANAAHWTESRYQQIFQGPERLALVAAATPASVAESETNARGDVVGFLVAYPVAGEWELENLVVAPAARRQGIAWELVDALLRRARDTRSESVFLEVREGNLPARNLYEKRGFRVVGKRKSYYSDPVEDAILYRWTA
jgi:ribosomal-protein-alanine N-acetyltransferase